MIYPVFVLCCHTEEAGEVSMCSVLWLLIRLASALLAGSVFDKTRSCLLENTAHTDSMARNIQITTPAHTFVRTHPHPPFVKVIWLSHGFLHVFLTVHPESSTPTPPLYCSPVYCNSHFSLSAGPPPHGKVVKLLMLLLGFKTMPTSLKISLNLRLCNASSTWQ